MGTRQAGGGYIYNTRNNIRELKSLNIDKTNKFMIFNKSGHMLSTYSFTFGNRTIQLCNEYVYLGIIFTSSGSFTKAITALSDKARKAFFKIREQFVGLF